MWAKGESGEVFESFTFGGKLGFVGSLTDPTYGLCHRSHSGPSVPDMELRSVPMLALAKFFREETWDLTLGDVACQPRPWLLPGTVGSSMTGKWDTIARAYGNRSVSQCRH